MLASERIDKALEDPYTASRYMEGGLNDFRGEERFSPISSHGEVFSLYCKASAGGDSMWMIPQSLCC